jgi:hypothetical protein
MKEHRQWLGPRAGKTAVEPPPQGSSAPPPEGIPLLLLPERVLFEVDASMLFGSLSSPDEESGSVRGPGEGPARKIGSLLVRLWLRQWEF